MTSPAIAQSSRELVCNVLQPVSRYAGTKSSRYELLDLWRGVACLLVVLYHSTLIFRDKAQLENISNWTWGEQVLAWMQYGNFGVPMFFVISGYCIAATACSAQRKETPLTTYFWRRFKRIYPPYWAALVLLVASFLIFDVWLYPGVLSFQPWAQLRPWWFSPSQWLGNLTLTETWRHHLAGSQRGHILGQSWTLCYEEQFYAVVGCLLLFRAKWFFPLCGIVTMGCIVAQQIAYAARVDILGFFFDGQWLSFALGIAVFYATTRLGTSGQVVTCVALVLAAAGLLLLPGANAFQIMFTTAFAILLVTLRNWDAKITNTRVFQPLFVCGTMCYSLYLVHQLIVAGISRGFYQNGVTSAWGTLLITVPICLLCSLAAGWLFYQTVERRFLNSPSEVAA
jgi:peptidoglycan/LPS O-acetylase OafA/YrhL